MRPPQLCLSMAELVDFAIEHVEAGALDSCLVHFGNRLLQLGHRHTVLAFCPAGGRPRLLELLNRYGTLLMERLSAVELRSCELELRLEGGDRPLRSSMARVRRLQPAPGLLVDEIALGREPLALGLRRTEPGFELIEQQTLLACIDPGDDLIAGDTVAGSGRQFDQPAPPHGHSR